VGLYDDDEGVDWEAAKSVEEGGMSDANGILEATLRMIEEQDREGER
jgi:hypothetical protein